MIKRRELNAIVRPHILSVAMSATVTFAWLMTGRYLLWLAPIVAADWFFVNLLNRVTDIDEDAKNGILGTAIVARYRRSFFLLAVSVALGSLAITHVACPALTPWRVIVQLIGLGYSYPLIPTPRGMKRIKEIFAAKNFGSACIFVLTGFAYPCAVAQRAMPFEALLVLILFFIPFEMTFEILYDMRDIEGDRAEHVPTFPVAFGHDGARKIIDALLVLAAAPLVIAFALHMIGVRELLFVAAPIVQYVFYKRRFARGINADDCILVTYLAAAELVFFLVGNMIWLRAGLPANVYVGVT